jgi:dipeptidyl aminopeptidase/acylaminoacyl peptidase
LFQVPVAGGKPEKLPTPFTGNWPQPLDASGERSEVLVEAAGELVVWSAVQNRVRRVANAPCEFAQWSPDHSLIACATERALEVMDADGSRRRMLRPLSAAGALAWWPNGRGIRYSGAIRPGEAFRIRDYNLDNGADSSVLPDQLGPANAGVYLPHGWHVYASGRDHNLYAAQDHGDPVALTRGPVQFYRVIASADGETLYAMGQTRRGELMRFDAGSGQWRAFLGGMSADAVAFAPRGDRVAYVTYPEKELWTTAVDGSHTVQITANPGRAYHPSWSPDGQTLVYSALNSNGVWRIFVVEPGSGSPREIGPVSDRALDAFDPNWSPDGRQIAFAPQPGGPREELGIYVADMQGNETLLPGTRGLWSPRWAPDNSSIAALDRDFRLVRYDLRTGTTRMLVDEACGWPHWSGNGRWIYFLAGARQAIARVNAGSGQVETLMPVPFPITGNTMSANWEHNFYVGFGPDDEPILLKDFDVSEIYALRLALRRF